MTDKVAERIIAEAKHIINSHDTVRKTARIFGVSKSTVHNDMSKKLRALSYGLYKKVQNILQENFKDKHIRGGEATRKKYFIKERC